MADYDGGAKFPKITEDGLDDLRKRIGVKIENTVEPWNYEAIGILHMEEPLVLYL